MILQGAVISNLSISIAPAENYDLPPNAPPLNLVSSSFCYFFSLETMNNSQKQKLQQVECMIIVAENNKPEKLPTLCTIRP